MVLGFAVLNPIALRKTKIAYNFVLSECNRVNYVSLYWIVNLPVLFQRLKLPISNPLSNTEYNVTVPHMKPKNSNRSPLSAQRQNKHDVSEYRASLSESLGKSLCIADNSRRDSLDDQVDSGSLGPYSESPLTSPSHSKSSSCDTLDSLDSGLESSSHMTGSHDSLDWSQNYLSKSHYSQAVHFSYNLDQRTSELAQDCSSDAPLSPLGSPTLETDDENSPTLIAFRKTGTVLEVRNLWVMGSAVYFLRDERQTFQCVAHKYKGFGC